MRIEIQKNAQETVVKLIGRLDTTTAPALEKTIREDVADAKNLVLDLKGLEYVSSAGLRVLLAAQKKMPNAMKLTNVQELVMEVFEITGFSTVLVIE